MAGCRNTLPQLSFQSEAFVAQLVVVEGPAMGRTFDIGAGTTVGTTSKCAVCIPDRRVPDFHARIELRDGVFYMQSLAPEESFQINGRAVREGPLQHGDMLTIGETLLLFDHDERTAARKDSTSSSSSSFSDLLDSSVYRRQKLYDDAKSLVRTFQIHGKDEKKLAILYQFTNEIVNIFDMRALGAKILEVLRQVFPVDRAVVMVQEDGAKRFVPVATWSARSAGGDPKASRTILREALKSRQGLITMDAMDDERFLSGQSIVDQNIHSAMCVPLIHNEVVIGVIEIDKEESHAFEEPDLELMNGIALQAASAIQNVRVFTRRKRYTDNLVSLANATQRISSFLRESQLVKETMYLVCNLLGVDKCSLLLGDPNGQGARLKLAYAVGLDKGLWPEIRVESGQGLA
ncbi:MAG: GAF domain-containing protein, partial [Planctomycetes bacterium]|nr:GAF domain-containing protein [Planctomycetota bacterium]